MKNFIILSCLVLLIFICNNCTTSAVPLIDKKIIVKIENNFSTNNPPKYFKVLVNENFNFIDNKTITKGSEIYLELIKTVPEKIGKQDAYAVAKVKKIYLASERKIIPVKNSDVTVKISKYEKTDVNDKAVDAGITVANQFVKNIAAPAHFAKGAITNKEGNSRIESGAKEMYDSSVLSYASKGKPFIVKAGTPVTMSFNLKSDSSEK